MSEVTVTAPPPAAAESFSLRGPAPRVMRLSRKTLAGIGVAAGLGIGGSLIYALRPATPHQAQELFNTDSRAKADAIASAPSDYSRVPKLGPPLPGDLGRPILAAQQRGADVPVPPIGSNPPPPDPKQQAAEAARQRAAQERDSARTSSVFLSKSNNNGLGQQTEGLPAALPQAQAPAQGVAAAPSPGVADRQRSFLTRQSGPTMSADRLISPVSPNIVQAGTIIPAALITGVRSDLPGQISAQVTENVYDSPTGRVLLIPQGARLIGEYDSELSFGQNRVLLAWDRLILPDGQSITLDRQPGADAAGMAGLQDRTNQHWAGVIKAALISTLLGIGSELGTTRDDALDTAFRRGGQDTINQAGQQVVSRELSVKPTLTIRPGFALRVIVTRDLVLEPIGNQR